MSVVLKKEIIDKVKKYYQIVYKPKKFRSEDYINYSGYVGNHKELQNIVDCALNRWFTLGKYSDSFSTKLCNFLGVKYCILTNSGSSANLLAISSLTSPLLLNHLNKGDEIITTACCFPTTVAPVIQNGLVPVFVDVDLHTFNIIPEQIEKVLSPKTKAILLTHSFGNPVNMEKIMKIAKRWGLWVVSDCCDALGAKWKGKSVESIGDISTCSFYPAHHITTGEGGAVITNNIDLKRIIQSYRDWGRDCWCKPGEISNCKNRFHFQFGQLPIGYDHKYIYTNIGYNLKMDDLNAAIGDAQIDKLPIFIKKRNENFKLLFNALKVFKGLKIPTIHSNASPSWFAFPFTVPNRDDLVKFLEDNKIQTRLIFAGNILKQPAFSHIRYRKINNLYNTNTIMKNSLFLGVYPGLTKQIMRYIVKKLEEYFNA